MGYKRGHYRKDGSYVRGQYVNNRGYGKYCLLLILITFFTGIGLAFSQQKDTTQFLGIPIDGSKTEMIKKLKSKGFTSSQGDKDILEGEFNGNDIFLNVVTNNNKVWRIGLVDANFMGETDVKIRFNNLVGHFMNNERYTSESDATNFIIPDDEDIGYEIAVNDKRYQAQFYQMNPNKQVWFMIKDDYGKYGILMFYENLHNEADGSSL